LCAPWKSAFKVESRGFHKRNRIRFLAPTASVSHGPALSGRREQNRTLRIGIWGQRVVAEVLQTRVLHPAIQRSAVKSLPEMSHRLAQILTVVRHHVEHEHASARLEYASGF